MIATKHLTEAQRILQEHCNNCRNKGPGCAVCHISQAIKEINSAQAARQAEPPKAKDTSYVIRANHDGAVVLQKPSGMIEHWKANDQHVGYVLVIDGIRHEFISSITLENH